MEHTQVHIEGMIADWRNHWIGSGRLSDTEVAELEDHLREEIALLVTKGLSDEEAFLIAVRRMGNLPKIAGEFRAVNTGDIWKKLFTVPVDLEDVKTRTRDLILVIILALSAGILIEIPKLFGIIIEENEVFYAKNMSFFVLPFITYYFFQKRRGHIPSMVSVGSAFLIALVLMNLYPFAGEESHTLVLSVLHLPLCLWICAGIAYTGTEWREVSRRMDFLRFSGELFIYETLLMCGVFVMSGLTIVLFQSIGIKAEDFVFEYFAVPVGAASLVLAAYLVDQKKSVVENFTPILARIFAPLLLLVMLAFLGAIVLLQKSPFLERSFLIEVDFMLILVLGIVFYIISTKDKTKGPQLFDWINLALIVVALVIDTIALSAILFRLSSFGVSPNKLAALGENVLIFINLLGMAFLYVPFMQKKIPFDRLEHWQTRLLPFYAAWLGFVALAFPPLFSFI